MNVLPVGTSLLALFACNLGAQVAITPLPVAPSQTPIHRVIPADLGSGSIQRIVKFDPDADLLHDLAILWSGGVLALCYSPEVLPSFAAAPVSGVTDMARVPAAAALAANMGPRDLLLLANGTSLSRLGYDPAFIANPGNPAGVFTLPVNSSPAWQSVVRLEVCYDAASSNCWVVGLASDLVTVRIGKLVVGELSLTSSVVAAAPVKEMLMMARGNGGQPQVVARTTQGIQMWTPAGAVLGTFAAPTAGPLGAICCLGNGTLQRLAWVALDGIHWRLRIYDAAVLHQDVQLVIAGSAPERFRLVNIGAMRLDGGLPDALVVYQNTTVYQTVLMSDTAGDYVPAYTLEFQEVTGNIDNCPALFDDMNNDGRADLTAALQSHHCVKIQGIMPKVFPLPGGSSAMGPPDAIDFDLLPHECSFGWSGMMEEEDDIIQLYAEVPVDYAQANLLAHVVTWHQFVADPRGGGSTSGPFGYEDVQIRTNDLFNLQPSTGALTRPILEVDLPLQGLSWIPQHHYYFMLRLIRRNTSGAIIWTSPVQITGLIAGPHLEMEDRNFMHSICAPSPPGNIEIHGGTNRAPGVFLKPFTMDPPPSSVKVPSPPSGTPTTPNNSWTW